MKMRHIIYKPLLTMLLLPLSLSSVAQVSNSPAAMEKLKEQNLWFHTKNAAGTVYDNTRQFSNIVVNYDMENGDFKRPQQGKKDNTWRK